jgi:hypothetical protein
MNKITSINGTLLASLNELKEHTENETAHVTEEDRIMWNAKADASALTTKVDASTFNVHQNNVVVHVTATEREEWNAKQDAIVDDAGNMALAGRLTAQGGTFSDTIHANGGVRVPAPATAQEALSYEALMERQALQAWYFLNNNRLDMVIPSWATTIMRNLLLSSSNRVTSPNAIVGEGICNDDLQDILINIAPAAGISLIGRSTSAWKFAGYMGNNRSDTYAAAASWRIAGSDKVSILLGSTTQGYSSSINPADTCYAHPIHWCDYNRDGMDYRYPLANSINGAQAQEMAPAWQVTVYPKGYLGSSTSCLVRGTHYGPALGESSYVWALAPAVTYVSVAIMPRKQGIDPSGIANRWGLFIDNNYVMNMTSMWLGLGNTACITTKAKAHDVSSTLQVGLRMGGLRIDSHGAPLGITRPIDIMERVVMRDVTVKPVPDVTASVQEVSAEGGEVTLRVSSTLSEAIYVINDTMCGHNPAAVWCTQSNEQIPSGGGQVTLTLAANTTGAAREVWAFVSHHYGQAAVVKIIQSA